jgi:hypothetical protein
VTTKPVELYGGPFDGMKVRIGEATKLKGVFELPIDHYSAVYGNLDGKWEFYGYDIDEQSTERSEDPN